MNALKDEKSNNIKKYNILNILENVGSIFTAETYLRYKELPKETMFERSIAERLKLRKKTGKIERKEKYEKIKNELFKAYFTIN